MYIVYMSLCAARKNEYTASNAIVLNRFSTHILHNAFQELTKSNYRQCKWMSSRKKTHNFFYSSFQVAACNFQQNFIYSSYFFCCCCWFDECHCFCFVHVFMLMDFLSIVDSFHFTFVLWWSLWFVFIEFQIQSLSTNDGSCRNFYNNWQYTGQKFKTPCCI